MALGACRSDKRSTRSGRLPTVIIDGMVAGSWSWDTRTGSVHAELIPGRVPLPGIQDYVAKMEAERGLDKQDLPSQCLKLGEEVGELYRAVRKLQGQSQDPAGRTADVGDEAADALILLMSIVNRCGINLEDAFRAKEARNESRVWI